MHRALLTWFAFLVALALSPHVASSATSRWVELAPPPLAGGAAVSDPARSRMLIIGGSVDGFDHGTVWSVGLPGPAWSEIATTGVQPDVQPQAVILDPVLDRLVTFIGPVPASGTPAKVYVLDLASNTWSSIAFTGVPPDARAGYSAIYDPPRRRMLVFGGFVSASAGGTVYSNKVWALSLDGTPAWTQLATAGGPPVARKDHTAVYDPAADRMIVFGGGIPPAMPGGNQQPVDETWSLALAGTPTWTFLTPVAPAPSARYAHVAGIDLVGGRMLMFGGSNGTTNFFGDAWSLDLAASTSSAIWTSQSAPSGPAARTVAQGIWDATGNRLLIQGGVVLHDSEGVPSADLWALAPGVAPAWTALAPDVLAPPAVQDYAAAIDTTGDRLVLFGGGDTWTRALWDASGWLRSDAIGPGARTGMVSAADPAGGRMIVFGSQAGGLSTEVNGYDFLADTWGSLPNASPPHGRSGAFGAFDESRRHLYVYGGTYFDVPQNSNIWLDDTWAYDAAVGTWQILPGAGSLGARFGVLGIYDPLRDRLVAFGGQDSLGARNDLHELAFGGSGAWTPLAAMGTPPPPMAVTAAAYDPTADRMILFGNDDHALVTWELSLADPVTWSPYLPAGRIPFARSGELALFDARRGRILVHGGGTTSGPRNDTWALYMDETTPTLLSFLDADVRADRVRIRWYSGETMSGPASVLRSVDGAAFETVGESVQDGTGMLVYDDFDVKAGQRLEYALGVGGRRYGEVHATIPGAASLRLLGPNPAFGDLRVEFELPTDRPARLELVDVRGRRVVERRLDRPGAGGHVLVLVPNGTRPAPGVYFLRLIQDDGGAVTRKIVIAG